MACLFSLKNGFSAAVFDLDGTLLDTEPVQREAWAAAAAKHGGELTTDVYRQLVGLTSSAAAARMCELLGIQHAMAEVEHEWNIALESALSTVRPMPGAFELLTALSSRVPIAIATSSSSEHFAIKRAANASMFERVQVVVCGDNPRLGGRSKPDPSIFLQAAEDIGHAADTCIAIEDAVSGMRAAKAAGMFVVGVPDLAILSKERVLAAAPDVILPSLQHWPWRIHATNELTPESTDTCPCTTFH